MSFSKLPNNLPVPIDDGAARHLQGMTLPNVSLKATNGNLINIGYITGFVVITFTQ
ncbi:MAG: peroxiredoxin, partial [Symploca sp. SIO1C4]|nr:peroxiredoxin [Symploca sp. SIO1C4]